MKTILVAGVLAMSSVSANAQQQPQRFDPIVLDAATMNELGAAIDEIQMPPKVYRQIMGVFQQLEAREQAKVDKAKAAEAAKPKE